MTSYLTRKERPGRKSEPSKSTTQADDTASPNKGKGSPTIPPASAEDQIAGQLTEPALREQLSRPGLDIALKDISRRSGAGMRGLREQFESIRHQLEQEKLPPPLPPTQDEIDAEAAARERDQERLAAQASAQTAALAAANGLAESVDVFTEWERDFRKTGYIANRVLSRSLLLSHGALLLPKSAMFMFVGPSASGKSEAVFEAAKFLPEGKVLNITTVSEQALYYLNDISHKLVLFGEMHPAREGEDDYRQKGLRQLISENRITRQVVEKADGCTNTAVEKGTFGPCVAIATTTIEQGSWNDEFVNRASWVSSDDSVETTTAVLVAQAAHAMEPWRSSQSELTPVIDKWRAYHNLLQPFEVCVPYAEFIMPAPNDLTVRRLFPLLLMYVHISALLHQRTRRTFTNGDRKLLEATIDDYVVAYELLSENAPRVLELCSKRSITAFRQLKSKCFLRNLRTAQIYEIFPDTPASTVRRWIGEWKKAGLVEVDGAYGRENAYTICEERDLGQDLGLISPDELSRKYFAAQAFPVNNEQKAKNEAQGSKTTAHSSLNTSEQLNSLSAQLFTTVQSPNEQSESAQSLDSALSDHCSPEKGTAKKKTFEVI